ncbi:hypothetical protein ACJIZ3_023719 [Penstemon smallii]|uniref:Uncharacterized protein n=1 Tax=Penstemon smallii TaxID=265156 RepID=A0ABD3TSA3_9LAMI
MNYSFFSYSFISNKQTQHKRVRESRKMKKERDERRRKEEKKIEFTPNPLEAVFIAFVLCEWFMYLYTYNVINFINNIPLLWCSANKKINFPEKIFY